MSDSGRDDLGRFSDGNEFSNGRNKHLRQAELRQQFTEAVTSDQIQELARTLMTAAINGDLEAAKLLTGVLFKEQSAPAVALQINQGLQQNDRIGRALAVIRRVQAERAADAASLETG